MGTFGMGCALSREPNPDLVDREASCRCAKRQKTISQRRFTSDQVDQCPTGDSEWARENMRVLRKEVRSGPAVAAFTASMWVAVFLPGNIFGGLLEYSFVLLTVLLSLVIIRRHGLPNRIAGTSTRSVVSLFVSITFLIGFSFLAIQLTAPFSTGPRDFLELLRYPIYLGILVLVVSTPASEGRRVFESAVELSLWWSLAVAVALIADVPLAAGLLRESLYFGSKNYIDPSIQIYRLAAPFANPNFLAFYLVLVLNYLLYFSHQRRQLALLLLDLALLFLSGSRSGMLAALLVLLFFALHSIPRLIRHRDWRPLASLSAVLVAGALGIGVFGTAYVLGTPRITVLIEAVSSGTIDEEPNVAGRINMDRAALGYFVDSPLIGTGSMKYAAQDIIDNQFLTWLVRLGLLGFVPLVLFYSRVFWTQLRMASRFGMSLGVISLWGSTFLLLQSGAFLENFRLFFLYWTFVWITSFTSEPRTSVPERQ